MTTTEILQVARGVVSTAIDADTETWHPEKAIARVHSPTGTIGRPLILLYEAIGTSLVSVWMETHTRADALAALDKAIEASK